MKISLSSFVYFNYGLPEAISATAAAGYDGIDIWGGRPHAYRRDLSPEDIAMLHGLLESASLGLASLIPAQFRYPSSLCSPIETIRRDSIAYIQDGVELAAALGAPLVSVCPGHSLHGQGIEHARAALHDSLGEIAAYAAGRQIRIAIEPADRYETDLMHSTLDALKTVDALGFENLGVLLDTGHDLIAGQPAAEAVAALGDRLFHVHVDDNYGERDQHLVPGEGRYDFRGLIEALDRVGYEGYLAAELSWDYTVDPDPPVRRTAAYLRGLFD